MDTQTVIEEVTCQALDEISAKRRDLAVRAAELKKDSEELDEQQREVMNDNVDQLELIDGRLYYYSRPNSFKIWTKPRENAVGGAQLTRDED